MVASLRVAVVRFPGSNCDLDAVRALKAVRGVKPDLVWHEDGAVAGYDAVVLPGGFSFGDYLRAGSIAARSPALGRIARLAEKGVPILGICNGFQILIEAGLLPGALLRNTTLRFVCRWVTVRVDNNRTPFTRNMRKGQVLRMPIAHNEGRYAATAADLSSLSSRGGVVFRYCDLGGDVTAASNPTGTLRNIAGICNRDGNVVGLMPHPERAADRILSPFDTEDGALLFASLLRRE
ncbi:MAG: phosphoribosylformylglycinamidine synthase I [Nitrososphaerales archaeon]|nr:phosphoribosylformylglycinamidine synthase I [Nitrososphaerales archaeon]